MIRTALALLLLLGACAPAAPPRTGPVPRPELVADTAAARAALAVARDSVRTAEMDPAERVRAMTRLGMWSAADSVLAATPNTTDALRLARAELLRRRHRYAEAERLADAVLARAPGDADARLLRARLNVQAWRLDRAERAYRALLAERTGGVEPLLGLGRIELLRKHPDEALRWARRAAAAAPASAGAALLEADVRFWAQDPAGAEAPLRRALALDPWNPDARFALGYALWRRTDARLLPAMAAQWALALETDPLHYTTHWHWGNGHTQLTYADYAQPEDSTVRARLAAADSLVAAGRIDAAAEASRVTERRFPRSVLPEMLRGSAWYLSAHGAERAERLDSAETAFRRILARKAHYGPAHNGLAAVVKQRQMEFLADYDSLEAAIGGAPLPADSAFAAVFRDAAYYPGDRVRRMAAAELGPTAAYLPLLRRLELRFTIPPLHRDLAEAMDNPYFRTATTFDNRQWMDIRGVGGGAAGIEYVERGAHQERKVLLHEYVHLFHTNVLTDAEERRVRALFHDAARRDHFLDYYAANNEHEFLAQGIEALVSPVKVHPLNHKAVNTRADLARTDPAQLAFLDSLVARDRAALAGDTAALAGNWAQAYVTLARRALGGRDTDRLRTASALLDTALVWDGRYLPALIRMAAVRREQGRLSEAAGWLDRTAALDPRYAPVLRERAALAAARGEGPDAQAVLLRRALEIETDLAERAEAATELREMLARHSLTREAIAAARAYADSAPVLSTYLRDRRDEALAFVAELRAGAGYAAETLPFWAELVARKPQQYEFRTAYADALGVAGEPQRSLAVLEEGARILRSAGALPPAYAARLAELHLLRGDTAAAHRAATPLTVEVEGTPRDLRAARVLAALGDTAGAARWLAAADTSGPVARAELAYTRAAVHAAAGDARGTEAELRAALAADPGLLPARVALVRLLAASGRSGEAAAVRRAASSLPLPVGPQGERMLAVAAGG